MPENFNGGDQTDSNPSEVITDKNEIIPEDDWNKRIPSIIRTSKTIMDFEPPPLSSLGELQFKNLFVTAWISEDWNDFEEWRKARNIQDITGNNIELWLQEHLGINKVFLVKVTNGIEDGADYRNYYFYHKKEIE